MSSDRQQSFPAGGCPCCGEVEPGGQGSVTVTETTDGEIAGTYCDWHCLYGKLDDRMREIRRRR